MKKIYMIAMTVFAFGTLSAQSTGQINSKKNAKTVAASITMPEYKQATKQTAKKSKSSATEMKAVENKKKVKTQSK
ncbi:MAG: hypothetical protein JKY42_11905 [Flavobacteriales bacterium]|nr:hypothetical protein [Flavobacteriales bacterium]